MRHFGFQAGRKLRNDIFFNKKRREELKKTFLKGQKLILETSDLTVKPVLKNEYAKRQLETSVLAFTVTGLETVKKAEDFNKDTYLTKCRFYFLKKGKSAVIKTTFFKPLLDKTLKTTFVYFPQGLPENTKRKAFIYKRWFEFKGHKLFDKGAFRQKILNFNEFSLTLKGEKIKARIILKIINRDSLTYWSRTTNNLEMKNKTI